MKKMILVLVVLAILYFPGRFLHGNLNITKVGEWGKGRYYYMDVFVQGNYAYCAANEVGVDIIDITNPAQPVLVGNCKTTGNACGIYISGKYAYVAAGIDVLQIIDVSNPTKPIWVGNYDTYLTRDTYDVVVNNNYAYAADYYRGFMVIDISDPFAPFLTASYNDGDLDGFFINGKYAILVQSYYTPGHENRDSVKGNVDSRLSILDISTPSSPTVVGYFDEYMSWMIDVYASGTYAYVLSNENKLKIFDISEPSRPTPVGECDLQENIQEVFVMGKYAYITAKDYTNDMNLLEVIDVSDPANPLKVDKYEMPGEPESVHFNGDYMYVADGYEGLQVLRLSNPVQPTPVGSYDNLERSNVSHVFVRGNYAYMLDEYRGLVALDISNPAVPTLLGTCDTIEHVSYYLEGLYVYGNYAYVANFNEGLQIIDISNPQSPRHVGQYKNESDAFGVYVRENYAYIAEGREGLEVIDISNPAIPIQVGNYKTEGFVEDVWVSGNYAYLPVWLHGLQIIDISQPDSPTLEGITTIPKYARKVCVSGNHAYVVDDHEGLLIFDISTPSTPLQVGKYSDISYRSNIYIDGKYLYTADSDSGLKVLDISDPISPTLVGIYNANCDGIGEADVYVVGSDIYLADGRFLILHSTTSGNPPQITLSRHNIYFSSDNSGATTGSQSFSIGNSGGNALNWSVSFDQNHPPWLTCTPTSGVNSGNVVVSVNPLGLSVGTYHRTITVSSPFAVNSPQNIYVILNVYNGGQTSEPFGEFATPIDGAVVRSSIPVTGWALDDIGVEGVRIFREENGGLVYIGDAVMVEGARPDVEQAYPTYPNNYKAGWGYMMLTNFLPGGGNGTFKIHAIATDLEGNQVTLGTKTIICDNANAVKPFGAIDTPDQGGIASGSNYVNYGWVLTPLPNTIPTDGSTIRVWVDGVSVGNPVYNQFRQDIADLFPGYNNSNGAVGYFYLDTTQYENGVHTIQWTAADDAGNTDGIGSRYFTIQNTAGRSSQHTEQRAGRVEGRKQACLFRDAIRDIPVDHSGPVRIRKGYDDTEPDDEILTDEKGVINLEIKELERFEIHFFEPGHKNSTLKVNQLPIGSTLDAERGVFSWSPGPGFVGNYRLVFIEIGPFGNKKRREVSVTIRPKF